MRKSPILAATLLLCASAALAQQPPVTLKVHTWPPGQEMVPGTVVLITASGFDAFKVIDTDGDGTPDGMVLRPCRWLRSPDYEGDLVRDTFALAPDGRVERQLEFVGTQPGKRSIFFQVPADGLDPLVQADFTYGEPVPPPPPPPPPPPAELWGIVVEESRERTAQEAIVLASPKVRALFDKGEFRLLDDDTRVGTDLQPYLDRANGQKLPVLFLVDSQGTVYFEGALPGTVAEMEALVGKYKTGGRK